MMTEVTLSSGEIMVGAMVGVLRRVSALAKRRPEPYGWDAKIDPWGNDIRSSLAEMAVAKALDRYWNPLAKNPGDLEGDVGPVQVRSTIREDGCLILHARDKDEASFVLVTGSAPTFRIHGFVEGAEGKLPSFWRGDLPRPAFFVPIRALRPLEEIAA